VPPPYVSIRQHTSAYVSIRQHTSAYVSIRVAQGLSGATGKGIGGTKRVGDPGRYAAQLHGLGALACADAGLRYMSHRLWRQLFALKQRGKEVRYLRGLKLRGQVSKGP